MEKPGKVTTIQDHLFKNIFKCLDELDRIADSIEKHCDELDEMDREENPAA
jgi:hypothetical protein